MNLIIVLPRRRAWCRIPLRTIRFFFEIVSRNPRRPQIFWIINFLGDHDSLAAARILDQIPVLSHTSVRTVGNPILPEVSRADVRRIYFQVSGFGRLRATSKYFPRGIRISLPCRRAARRLPVSKVEQASLHSIIALYLQSVGVLPGDVRKRVGVAMRAGAP